MKIVRYSANGDACYGILEEDGRIRQLAGSPFESLDTGDVVTHLDRVRVLAPVEAPRVIGVGLNYAAHAREGGHEPPPFPMLFGVGARLGLTSEKVPSILSILDQYIRGGFTDGSPVEVHGVPEVQDKVPCKELAYV